MAREETKRATVIMPESEWEFLGQVAEAHGFPDRSAYMRSLVQREITEFFRDKRERQADGA